VVRLLQFSAQACHDLVPPDALEPVLRSLYIFISSIRVSVPYSFDTDPDPGFLFGQKLEKIYSRKKIKFVLDQKLQFTYP
jgi:hypothetical protein